LNTFVLIVALASLVAGQGCFPMKRQWGNGPSNMPLSQWWCGPDDLYGFLGFSLPLEDGCNYGYDTFLNSFKDMKQTYGATFVRIYLPTCRQTDFWVNMMKAARDTSLAVIPMIFWDWGQNDPIMDQAEKAFLGLFSDPEVGKIAQYLIHSVEFGDELGEEGNYWLSRMRDFKGQLANVNVSITITDDWDRGVYKNGDGSISSFGKQVNALSNSSHAHVQPYYHPDQCVDAYHFWDYFVAQLQWLVKYLVRPTFVSQTMWAYNQDGHQRGEHDEADNMDNYQQYWNTLDQNCALFKQMKIGWFFPFLFWRTWF